jgi:type IV pilus assembly protein PilE
MKNLPHGFTLVELLCVMAVVALLSSFALPSFHSSQQRGQRTLAKLALMKSAHWLERAASLSGVYPSTMPNAVWQSGELHYRLTLQSQSHAFVLIATPVGSQSQDPCGQLTLNHAGERGVQFASLSASRCWDR